MFIFKNIKTWSKGKLRGAHIICEFLYLLFMAIIPTIIICLKYQLFEAVTTKVKLTGVGLIMVIVLGLYIFVKCKDAINKLPQIKYSQQALKFTLQMVFNLAPMVLIIVGFWFAKEEVQLAYDTMLYCLISILGANSVNYLFLKYIEVEVDIRSAALFDKEKKDREGLV